MLILLHFNRSLLTERESQHSLGSLSSYGSSESEPKSAQSDPGRYTQEKSRFTFTHKDSSGSLGKNLLCICLLGMIGVTYFGQEVEFVAAVGMCGLLKFAKIFFVYFVFMFNIYFGSPLYVNGKKNFNFEKEKRSKIV